MMFLTVAGNVGRDAELKTTEAGDSYLKFSVASSKKVKGEDKTQWINCTMWGKRAEAIAQYVTKGTAVTVCGEPEIRTYEGKDDSGTQVSFDCRVADIKLQGSKGEARETAAPAQKPKPKAKPQPPAEDDDYA